MHIVPEPFRILGNPVNLFKSLKCELHNSPIYRVRGGGSPINGCNGAVSSVYAMWFKKLLVVKVFINSSNHTNKKYLDVTEVFPSGIQGPRSQTSYMQAEEVVIGTT